MQTFLQLLSLDPAWIRTGLRVVHLCGLVLGVGSATLLDLIIARFILMRGISYEHVYVVDFSSRIVSVGLWLLWVSGIGFLIHYAVFEPAKLQNPKIWAKIAIVVVLSINGFLVHYFVLPRIRSQVGKRLLDGLSPLDCSLVLLAGIVSAVSWYVPLVLGAIPQLNYVVPAEVILSSYALLLIAVNTVIQGGIALFLRGYSIPASSGRGKIVNLSTKNVLRGALALALGTICISLFVTRSTDYGMAAVEAATTPLAGEPTASTPKEAGLELASSRGGNETGGDKDNESSDPSLASEQSDAGIRRDAPVNAVGKSEGIVVERTASVNSSSTPGQWPLDRSSSAESFASLPKQPAKEVAPQSKSGFVGLWAADARVCANRPGAGRDLTVIGERGARAGGSSCAFKEKKQIASSEWEMKATCSDGSSRWESTVRLTLSKSKLKWSGQRGTQIYVKCT